MVKKKILIICYSNHNREPRVLMQCNALKKDYDITTAGLSGVEDTLVKFVEIKRQLIQPVFKFHFKLPSVLRWPFSFVNKLQYLTLNFSPHSSLADFRKLKNYKSDLIICHHPNSLEIAFSLQKVFSCKVIFNAHEIYPYEFEDNAEWMRDNFKAIDTLLSRYLSKCEFIFTVNQEICEFYSKRYNCKAIPVHNSKPYLSIDPSPVKSPIQLIHHGAAMPQRKLEDMAEAVLKIGARVQLTFMLMENNKVYLEELKRKYEPRGIIFVSPVNYGQIVSFINKYDVGIYLLPAGNINQVLALPNKLFEFVQAKLAVVCSPNIAMKNIIEKNDIGAVTKGFEIADLVESLNALDAEIIKLYKSKTEQASIVLASDKDENRVLQSVNSIF